MQVIGRHPQRAPDRATVHYERHRPEQTTLYRLANHVRGLRRQLPAGGLDNFDPRSDLYDTNKLIVLHDESGAATRAFRAAPVQGLQWTRVTVDAAQASVGTSKALPAARLSRSLLWGGIGGGTAGAVPPRRMHHSRDSSIATSGVDESRTSALEISRNGTLPEILSNSGVFSLTYADPSPVMFTERTARPSWLSLM